MRISDWSSEVCSSDLDENVFHAFNPSSAARPSSRRVRLQPCHLIQDRQFLLPASAAACPGSWRQRALRQDPRDVPANRSERRRPAPSRQHTVPERGGDYGRFAVASQCFYGESVFPAERNSGGKEKEWE